MMFEPTMGKLYIYVTKFNPKVKNKNVINSYIN